MVRALIRWAVANPLIVGLLAVALIAVGVYSFLNVNVEAYPDPAPAIIEVVAQYPGQSAEDVERQVTIPLETALAGMPGLKYMRSKALFGLSHIRNQFDYGVEFDRAKQDVINRLQQVPLPPGVTPQISPATPTGEIYRYTLRSPKDSAGRDIYTLNDLKALQDWTLSREFRRVPRIADVTSSGGMVKRYEIQPDPDRMQRFGVTLQQLQTAITNSNANVGGDYLVQGGTVLNVRGVGLLGGGEDPMQTILGLTDPSEAAAHLRDEENRRLIEIRQVILTTTNNGQVRVDDVVDGGPLLPALQGGKASLPREVIGAHGVVVAHQTRLGRVSLSRPRKDAKGRDVLDADGNRVWDDEDDKVQGIVLLKKGGESLPALRDTAAKIKELNDTPGRLPPGVKLEPYYDRTQLMGVTTATVDENLALGMILVSLVLLMFLNNVRSALIVAINIPLALLFAFSVLYLRGKSANLLSIGAVDFGIIVDSTVIMVENIYRHISSGEHPELTLKERIIRASGEVERSLFFSTVVMVCALLPLFVMVGPEGQIFGPMADTYAFALGGALLLALTVSPVLCLFFFSEESLPSWIRTPLLWIPLVSWLVPDRLPPARDNFLVRWIKGGYLWQLDLFLRFRWIAAAACVGLVVFTCVVAYGRLGQEFMPELEEGNIWLRGTFPANVSLEEVAARVKTARNIIQSYPEVEVITSQVGRPDDGTDPTGFYNSEFFIPLKPFGEWPIAAGHKRPRTKAELIDEMNAELNGVVVGVDWDFSQYIRDNVMEALSGVKGENSIKIFGPNLDELERLADQVKDATAYKGPDQGVRGLEGVGVFRIKGQSNLELAPDRDRCSRWGLNVSDVNNVIDTALRGKPFTQMIEGEKMFDVALRWPERLRGSESDILNIPVDVNNVVTQGLAASQSQTPLSGGSTGLSPLGTASPGPSLTGSQNSAVYGPSNTPRRRLGDLVKPVEGSTSYVRPGASTIYREQGQRFIAVKFGIRGRDLAGAVAEAQAKVGPLIHGPYRVEWSGEFQEMQDAEQRMLAMVCLSLLLIMILLYLAFRSLLDAVLVLSSVGAMSLGGVWALLLTGTTFNVSAAVGFISILGVSVMNGLLLVSSFNGLRSAGAPLHDALFKGVAKLVRPITMTALAAIFGLLPAALSTRIGSQSQRPLAIVVVGGMLMALALLNWIPLWYSFYGRRQPPIAGTHMEH